MGISLITNPFAAHVDLDLTNFAIEQMNRPSDFVADQIAPLAAVPDQSGKYVVFGEEALEDPGDVVRGPLAAPKELAMSLSRDSYACEDHAATQPYAREEEGAARGLYSPEQRATRLAMDRVIRLKRELDLIAKVTNAAEYSASNKLALAGGDKWSDPINSDPIGDILGLAKAVALGCGFAPNKIVFGWDVLQALKVHEDVKKRFVNVVGGAITLAQIAQVFEIPCFLSSARKKAAGAGGAKSFAWTAGSIWIGYSAPSPSMEDPSFAKTFLWSGAPDAMGGIGVETFDLYPPGRKGRAVDVHFWHSDVKITTKDAGALITGAV
jgi:hypothetical protein